MRLWHIIPATIIALGVALFAPAPAWLSVLLVIALGIFVVATVSVVFRREGTRPCLATSGPPPRIARTADHGLRPGGAEWVKGPMRSVSHCGAPRPPLIVF